MVKPARLTSFKKQLEIEPEQMLNLILKFSSM